MNIIHFNTSLLNGGLENMMVDIANQQSDWGHSVVIIIINNKIDESIRSRINANIPVFLIGRNSGSRSFLPIFKLFVVLKRLQNYQLIHCHALNVGRFLRFISLKKRILTIHDLRYRIKPLRYYSKIYAISNSVSRDIEYRSSYRPIVVHNGVRTIEIKSKKWHSQIEGTQKIHIVQVSRLVSDKKGQDILILALSKLISEFNYRNITVDFVGDGSSLRMLKDLTVSLGIDSYVNFSGNKPREWVYQHLSDYDIFVQPSRYEGFGLTVVEAMVAKLPVIVADNDGPAEIVGYGKYGFVFKKNDVDDLVAKLVNAIELINGNDLESFVERAYQYSLINFDIKRTAEQYLSEYQKLVVLNG